MILRPLVMMLYLLFSAALVGEAFPSDTVGAHAHEEPAVEGESLLNLITSQTPARKAAALRLIEEARQLVLSGSSERAVSKLDQAIPLAPLNSYTYFFLAQAHYRLEHFKQSLSFADEAERLLQDDPLRLSEVHALKGSIFREMGQPDKAEAQYVEALRLDSRNITALKGIIAIGMEGISNANDHPRN